MPFHTADENIVKLKFLRQSHTKGPLLKNRARNGLIEAAMIEVRVRNNKVSKRLPNRPAVLTLAGFPPFPTLIKPMPREYGGKEIEEQSIPCNYLIMTPVSFANFSFCQTASFSIPWYGLSSWCTSSPRNEADPFYA